MGLFQTIRLQPGLHRQPDDRVAGPALSLQSHTGRAELWIVLMKVRWCRWREVSRVCQANDEIWIPANEKHRLSCTGDKPVRVLEVAFGNWQQDDIKRYADDYARTL